MPHTQRAIVIKYFVDTPPMDQAMPTFACHVPQRTEGKYTFFYHIAKGIKDSIAPFVILVMEPRQLKILLFFHQGNKGKYSH
jgi:hypothetical protein